MPAAPAPVSTSPTGTATPGSTDDFSLVLGGPLFQLWRRAHLADDALALSRRRIFALALIAWLPLLLLSAATGNLLSHDVTVPFLKDFEVHTKFLVVLPLLVYAELAVHQRMRAIGRTFHERQLVPEASRSRFDAAIQSAAKLRNSVWVEVLLIGIVYAVGITIVWRHYTALTTATWYASPASAGSSLTAAGLWYGYVSLPLFQFLLCRWYFRIFVWGRLIWQVARIDLALVPTHPDRVGGLGFLSNTVYAFVPLLLAHGALLSGQLANRIFYEGASLVTFRLEIVLLVIFTVFLVVGPLLALGPQLARLKREGLKDYGTLAQRYTREFDAKWVRGGATSDDVLLGSGDVQSLADLGNSFDIIKGIRINPVSKEAIVQLAFMTLAPIAPLVLTMMPLDELLKRLLGIVF